MDLLLCVKHGTTELNVELWGSSTVLQLKQQLEEVTGIFVRNQKLIYKGKVLADGASLDACKVGNGAKLMLLATEGLPVKGQPPAARGVAQQRIAAITAGTKARNGSHAGAGSSSLLAEKMYDMAGAAAASKASTAAAALSMKDRHTAWGKTGIIALRDLQLTVVQQDWLQGLSSARAADLSHNRLSSLPSSLCHLSSLSSLKLNNNCLQDHGIPWQQLCAGLSNLSSLLLGNNQLQTVPSCVSQLTDLVSLGLEGNHLTHLEPGALAGLTKLEVLQLQNNQLQQLPIDIGCCSNLVAMNAGCNALTALPDSMSTLAKLQVLVVDNNRLTALPPQLLAGCSSLCTLNAHQNPMTVEHLRSADGYQGYEARRQARATKQLEGRVLADVAKSFSEGADVEQWQRWATGPTGLGSDGSGRAGR